MRSNRSIHACIFCDMVHDPSHAKTKVLYQDSYYFAFYDICKATAKEHILVCTKQHYETALDVPSKHMLVEMREKGKMLLDEICEKEGLYPQYRFGFHLRPFNSVNHIHLHCFVLPFANILKDKFSYGKMLSSIEEVVEKLNDKRMTESLGRL